MVWNSTQQSMYSLKNAVESYNRSFNSGNEPAQEQFFPEKPRREKEEVHRKPPEMPPPAAAKPPNPLEKLLSDKDTLLIAGLIFILIHEKADSMLIAALLIILIS